MSLDTPKFFRDMQPIFATLARCIPVQLLQLPLSLLYDSVISMVVQGHLGSTEWVMEHLKWCKVNRAESIAQLERSMRALKGGKSSIYEFFLATEETRFCVIISAINQFR